MTSPRFSRNGNFHLALRPEYLGETATHSRGYDALYERVKDVCEVYPQKKRKFRLPFGRDQFIIDDVYDARTIQVNLDWIENLYWLNKLDPIAIDDLSMLPPATTAQTTIKQLSYSRKKALELYEHGLQEPSSRHQSQFTLALYLYRTCLQLVHQAILRNIKRMAQILILVSLVTSRPSQFFQSTRH